MDIKSHFCIRLSSKYFQQKQRTGVVKYIKSSQISYLGVYSTTTACKISENLKTAILTINVDEADKSCVTENEYSAHQI